MMVVYLGVVCVSDGFLFLDILLPKSLFTEATKPEEKSTFHDF